MRREIKYAQELNLTTWKRCENLWLFGEFFADEDMCPQPPSDRQFRLMMVAAVRAVWEHLIDSRSRAAVEAAERYADTQDAAVLTSAEQQAERAYDEAGAVEANDRAKCLAYQTASAALAVLDPELNDDPGCPYWVEKVTDLERDTIPGRTCEQATALHLRLFHDLFSDPFRPLPLISSTWLTWSCGTVKRLAEAAYEHRILPAGALDSARLAVLADALEEAGCTAPEILDHLRDSGLHWRGCHILDLLLAKE